MDAEPSDRVPRAAADRVVLLGDSHLAKMDRRRLDRLESVIGDGRIVVNHACGGSTAEDVARELEAGVLREDDTLVLSVGTNDYPHWKRVPIGRFRAAVEHIAALVAPRPLIVLEPPRPDLESQRRRRPDSVRTESERIRYATVLREVVTSCDLVMVALPTDRVLTGRDGVHLGDEGYDVLLAAIAAVVCTRR